MRHPLLAGLVAAFALFLCGASEANAKPDPAKMKADVEALVRWINSPEETLLDPSPTELVARLTACGEPALRAVFDEGARNASDDRRRQLRSPFAAAVQALWD